MTGDVLIADRDLPLHMISWDDLVKARGSTYRPFPPKNLYQFGKFLTGC
jgi:hypothetical protein